MELMFRGPDTGTLRHRAAIGLNVRCNTHLEEPFQGFDGTGGGQALSARQVRRLRKLVEFSLPLSRDVHRTARRR